MSEQLTPEQQQEGLRKAIEWRDTVCPKGLLDPLTHGLHPISSQKISAYIDERGGDTSSAWLSKAVEALWDQLVWFGAMPPKPKRKPKEPKYDPPLRPCDAKRVNREFRENQQRERDEAQKILDKALAKTKEKESDARPGAVYYPESYWRDGNLVSHPQSGKINWAETKRLQDQWDATHGNF